MGALGRPRGGGGGRAQPDLSETKKISRIQPDQMVRLDGLKEGEPMKIPVLVFLMLLYLVIFGWGGF